MPEKKPFSENDVVTLTKRYDTTTLLTMLQELSHYACSNYDWNEMVKKTSTGISNPKEYQMLWRHLAYRYSLPENLEEIGDPMDDDSDLDCELEPLPSASVESASESLACVKVMTGSRTLSESTPSSSTIEAPLTVIFPACHSSRTPAENSQPSNLMRETSIIFPVIVQRQTLPTVSSTDALETKGLVGGTMASNKRKRKAWSEEEDNQLRAAVQRLGEGNWANIAKGDTFAIKRTATQLSQRWSTLRKKDGSSSSKTAVTSTQYPTAEHLATRHSLSLALDMPFKKITAPGMTNPGRTSTPNKNQVQSCNTMEVSTDHSSVPPQCPSQQALLGSGGSPPAKPKLASDNSVSKCNTVPGRELKPATVHSGAQMVSRPNTVPQFKVAAQAKNVVNNVPAAAQAKNVVNNVPSASQAKSVVNNVPAASQAKSLVNNVPAAAQARNVVYNVPAAAQAKNVVHNVPAAAQAKHVVNNVPATSQAKSVVNNVPAVAQARNVVYNVPAAAQAKNVVHNVPAAAQAKHVVNNVPAAAQVKNVVNNVPAAAQAKNVVHNAPATAQAKYVVHNAPAAAQVKNVVHNAPAAAQVKNVVNNVPAAAQVKNVVNNVPAAAQAKNVVHNVPAAAQAKNVVHNVPAAAQAKNVVHNVPAAAQAKNVVHNVPAAAQAKNVVHNVPSAAQVNNVVHNVPAAAQVNNVVNNVPTAAQVKNVVHNVPAAAQVKSVVHNVPAGSSLTKTSISAGLPSDQKDKHVTSVKEEDTRVSGPGSTPKEKVKQEVASTFTTQSQVDNKLNKERLDSDKAKSMPSENVLEHKAVSQNPGGCEEQASVKNSNCIPKKETTENGNNNLNKESQDPNQDKKTSSIYGSSNQQNMNEKLVNLPKQGECRQGLEVP